MSGLAMRSRKGDEWVDRPVDDRSIGESSDVGVELVLAHAMA